MKKHVVPYLKDHIFVQDSINKARFRMQGVNQKVIQSNMMEQSQKEEVEPSSSQLLDGSLSYWWPTPRKLVWSSRLFVSISCMKQFNKLIQLYNLYNIWSYKYNIMWWRKVVLKGFYSGLGFSHSKSKNKIC